jgi:protein-L-isoaspartate O-methyltransferase
LPGAAHVASEHAIHGLIKWLERRHPMNVLEVGAGIGTLTETVLKTCEWHPEITSIEWNEFCLKQLTLNLANRRSDFKLVTNPTEQTLSREPYDFIIIDGGEQNPLYVARVAHRGLIFIEGFMDKKHRLIEEVHPNRPFVKANFRTLNRKSGYWVFLFEPTATERAKFRLIELYNRFASRLKRRFIRATAPLTS